MAKPIAYFSYSKNEKVLSFRDLSLNVPTSYQWDFGDGQTSTDKNPIVTYVDNGFYQVSLVSSNVDGDSDALVLQIGVGDSNETLDIQLIELINQFIPDDIVGYSTISEKANLIRKWQSYLWPLVFIPFKVAEEDTYNEFAWPLLANNLIAMLVANDLIKILVQRAMTSILTGATSSESGTADSNVKKITTGPSEVEFHGSQEQSKTISSILGNDGASQQLILSICNLSQRLRIYLPNICEKLPKKVILPKVFRKCYPQLHWEKWLPLGNYYYPFFITVENEKVNIVNTIIYVSELEQYVPITFENTSELEVILVTVEDKSTGETYNSNFSQVGKDITIEPVANITGAKITLLLG